MRACMCVCEREKHYEVEGLKPVECFNFVVRLRGIVSNIYNLISNKLWMKLVGDFFLK